MTENEAGTLHTFTASDGYVGHYRLFPALTDPARGLPSRGTIVCLHGIQSHGGWYTRSCRRLADAGYRVLFLDRRGSGLNEATRGDTPSFRRLIDDVAEFLRGQAAPGPVVLLAISWGGKLAVGLQRRHPGLVDGLALLCPGLCPRIKPTLGTRLATAWARLIAPGRRIPIPLDDPALFTASPTWQTFIREDPLTLRQITARFAVESVRLDLYLRFTPRHVTIPVLLLLAGQDRIIDNERTRAFVGKCATSDRTVHEYPDAQHTLEFEPEPHPFLDDLLAWLERRKNNSAGT